MSDAVISLALCHFGDLKDQSCFFFQLPEEPMMVFRKCSEDSAQCIDNGVLYVFSGDVPVAPQSMH